MELWIRSSDKERLLKVSGIKYEHYRPFLSEYYKEVLIINDNLIEEYETKERCIEILDDIHNVLKGNIENHINKFDVYRDNNLIVYQMPEK